MTRNKNFNLKMCLYLYIYTFMCVYNNNYQRKTMDWRGSEVEVMGWVQGRWNVRDGKEEKEGRNDNYILIKILKLMHHTSISSGISDSWQIPGVAHELKLHLPDKARKLLTDLKIIMCTVG